MYYVPLVSTCVSWSFLTLKQYRDASKDNIHWSKGTQNLFSTEDDLHWELDLISSQLQDQQQSGIVFERWHNDNWIVFCWTCKMHWWYISVTLIFHMSMTILQHSYNNNIRGTVIMLRASSQAYTVCCPSDAQLYIGLPILSYIYPIYCKLYYYPICFYPILYIV